LDTADLNVNLLLGCSNKAKPSWDEYGLKLAQMVAQKSKDPSTQCGCVIMDIYRRVVSTGYNGFARSVPDDVELLHNRQVKYDLTIHAETNAVIFAHRDLSRCSVYIWPIPPCSRCASVLAQAGISRVVTLPPTSDHLSRWGDSFKLAQWIYVHAGIEYVELEEMIK
jgi:dCMP deaminase